MMLSIVNSATSFVHCSHADEEYELLSRKWNVKLEIIYILAKTIDDEWHKVLQKDQLIQNFHALSISCSAATIATGPSPLFLSKGSYSEDNIVSPRSTLDEALHMKLNGIIIKMLAVKTNLKSMREHNLSITAATKQELLSFLAIPAALLKK
jgi:hypothetical protein